MPFPAITRAAAKFGVKNFRDAVNLAGDAASAYGAYQTAKGLREQNKQLKRQEAAQQEADRKAQAEKAHSDREMRWRLSARRRGGRGGGYGVNRAGGYPTGYLF